MPDTINNDNQGEKEKQQKVIELARKAVLAARQLREVSTEKKRAALRPPICLSLTRTVRPYGLSDKFVEPTLFRKIKSFERV